MEQKRKDKFSIYERIVELCNKTILRYARNNNMRCFYEVPEVMLGYPVYNINNAISYVLDKLKQKGYLVRYYFPNYLYISWDDDEITGKLFKMPQQTQSHALVTNPIIEPQLNNTLGIRSTHHDLRQQQPSHHAMQPVQSTGFFPPPPVSGRLPAPPSKGDSAFVKSISDFRPSGKFVLDLQ